MCGIFGIISKDQSVASVLIDGLKRLEYRGYDSAGISMIVNDKLENIRNAGKVSQLEEKIKTIDINGNIGIAHTRWATHGKPVEKNAHPHLSFDEKVSLVHNGIIENYKDLKIELMDKGIKFRSETDTEVIPNLIAYYFKETKDEKQSIFKTIERLEGSFAFVALFAHQKDKIYIARKDSPLLVGFGKDTAYVASSLSAFSHLTNRVVTLEDDDVGILEINRIKVYDKNLKPADRKIEEIEVEDVIVDKGGYPYFMLKEIYEQPKVVRRIINEYIDLKSKKIILPKFPFDLKKIERMTIVACGTSYYAGYVLKYYFERVAKVHIDIDIASEFRYRDTPLQKGGIALFISQSGETADTIGALKYCKEHGQKIISLVNVVNSSIASLSDVVLKLVAGIEIGVASTKAFVAQVVVLSLLATEIAKAKGEISDKEYRKFIDDLIESDKILSQVFQENIVSEISKIAKTLIDARHIIYIGRDFCYPLALEGALKLKEISYIPTQGVASGELKHGTIALIDNQAPVVAIAPTSSSLFAKSVSNIEEIFAREGRIILISDKTGLQKLKDAVSSSIEIPYSDNPILTAISCVIPMQLLAYYVALYKGNDIDKPKNLAKSVTVE